MQQKQFCRKQRFGPKGNIRLLVRFKVADRWSPRACNRRSFRIAAGLLFQRSSSGILRIVALPIIASKRVAT